MSAYECTAECRRLFGSIWAFDRHRSRGRCKRVAELRAMGLRKNAIGVWVRSDGLPRQERLPILGHRKGQERSKGSAALGTGRGRKTPNSRAAVHGSEHSGRAGAG